MCVYIQTLSFATPPFTGLCHCLVHSLLKEMMQLYRRERGMRRGERESVRENWKKEMGGMERERERERKRKRKREVGEGRERGSYWYLFSPVPPSGILFSAYEPLKYYSKALVLYFSLLCAGDEVASECFIIQKGQLCVCVCVCVCVCECVGRVGCKGLHTTRRGVTRLKAKEQER